MADEPIPLPPRRRGDRGCPICGRPADAAHRPFCSARCRQVDLARWFAGSYRVEAADQLAPEDFGSEGETR